ncbi:hypothetical protein MAR_024682 [Mya arenaria]|uniref:Uncharacterized protein n=1 Tax=Mya arenaria TaxID=6604 RepID=A0ABY7DUL1_MYAAR|nr:hypothetical protein MAR_024682 [Mya arenaria]
MDYEIVLVLATILLNTNSIGGVGVCNWPALLQDSIWVDSDKGSLDFNTKTMTGLTYVAMGTITIDSWRCYFYNDVDTLIMKADTLVTIFSTFYQPFQCWKMTQITENSYYYYIQSEKQIRINMERITLRDNETITDMTDANVISRLCSDVASVNEYHLLVKDNQEANAAVACPSVFQDDFHYSMAVQNSMGQLEVSQSPNSCTENQTTVDIPKHEDAVCDEKYNKTASNFAFQELLYLSSSRPL